MAGLARNSFLSKDTCLTIKNSKKIILDFVTFSLKAALNNSESAQVLYANLPLEINLVQWGRELYGDTQIHLPERNLVSELETGSIAYSSRGNYLCVFYGQQPAWPVEVVGKIDGSEWEKLKNEDALTMLRVYADII